MLREVLAGFGIFCRRHPGFRKQTPKPYRR